MRWLYTAWFDPAGVQVVWVHPSVAKKALKMIKEDSPLSRSLGILPKGADEVLRWAPDEEGGWHELDLGAMQARKTQLQMILARGCLAIWLARCRLMAEWWKSPLGVSHHLYFVRADTKRKRKRAEAEAVLWQAKRPCSDALVAACYHPSCVHQGLAPFIDAGRARKHITEHRMSDATAVHHFDELMLTFRLHFCPKCNAVISANKSKPAGGYQAGCDTGLRRHEPCGSLQLAAAKTTDALVPPAGADNLQPRVIPVGLSWNTR
jgi:hypothetical protein